LGGYVKIPGVQAMAASLIMLGAMIAIPIATAGPAAAAGTIPAAPQSCSGGQPKLDYEYININTRVSTWSNVCGTGDWTWDTSGTYQLLALRMPTTPTHRVWLHLTGVYTGEQACVFSQNADIYVWYLTNPGSDLYQVWTGDVQVSANTASC
jgi:hypothetical protein